MEEEEVVDRTEEEWGEFIKEEKFRKVGEEISELIVKAINDYIENIDIENEEIKRAIEDSGKRIIKIFEENKELIGKYFESIAKLIELKLQFMEMYLEDVENFTLFRDNINRFFQLSKIVAGLLNNYKEYRFKNRKLAKMMRALAFAFYGLRKARLPKKMGKIQPRDTLISRYYNALYYSRNILLSASLKREFLGVLKEKLKEYNRERKEIAKVLKAIKKEIKRESKIKKLVKREIKRMRKGKKKEEVEEELKDMEKSINEVIKEYNEILKKIDQFINSLIKISKDVNGIIKNLNRSIKDYRKIVTFGRIRGPIRYFAPKYLVKMYKNVVKKHVLKGDVEGTKDITEKYQVKYDYIYEGKKGIMKRFLKITGRVVKDIKRVEKIEDILNEYSKYAGEKTEKIIINPIMNGIKLMRRVLIVRLRKYGKLLERTRLKEFSGADELIRKFEKEIDEIKKKLEKGEKEMEKQVEEVEKIIKEEEKAIEEVSEKISDFIDTFNERIGELESIIRNYRGMDSVIKEVEEKGGDIREVKEEIKKALKEIENQVKEVLDKYDEIVKVIRETESVLSTSISKEFSKALDYAKNLSKENLKNKEKSFIKAFEELKKKYEKEINLELKMTKVKVKSLKKEISEKRKLEKSESKKASKDLKEEIENLQRQLKMYTSRLISLKKDKKEIKAIHNLVKKQLKDVMELYNDIVDFLSMKNSRKYIIKTIEDLEKNIEDVILELDDEYEDIFELYHEENFLGALGKAAYIVGENVQNALEKISKIELVKNPEKTIEDIQKKINSVLEEFKVELRIEGDSINVEFLKVPGKIEEREKEQMEIIERLKRILSLSRKGGPLTHSMEYLDEVIHKLDNLEEDVKEIYQELKELFDDNYDKLFTALWNFGIAMRKFEERMRNKDLHNLTAKGKVLVKENIGRFELVKRRIKKGIKRIRKRSESLSKLKRLPIFGK